MDNRNTAEPLASFLESTSLLLNEAKNRLNRECRDMHTLRHLRDRLDFARNMLRNNQVHIPNFVYLHTICTAELHNTHDLMDKLQDPVGDHTLPKNLPDKDSLAFLKQQGIPTSRIAAMYQVHKSTVDRWLNSDGLREQCTFTSMTDEELDQRILLTLNSTPGAGSSIVHGSLRSAGIKVQRDRVRTRLRTILAPDFGRLEARLIRRRTYHVPSCNSLWHLDGNHKLITYGFVIHGAIDGFSRCVTFLQCVTNNRANTVLQGYQGSCKTFGVPSRVRTDNGGENADVWTFMTQVCGPNRGSFIPGKSVHNQRIERFWRDLTRTVVMAYKNSFISLCEQGYLDPDSDQDLCILHFVFLPRIRQSLHDIRESWNHHSVRTENYRSPYQLWTEAAVVIGVKGLDPADIPVLSTDYDFSHLVRGTKVVNDVSSKLPVLWDYLNQNVLLQSNTIPEAMEQYVHLRSLFHQPVPS